MDCASCHDPHDSTKPKMVSAEWVNEKCLTCHTEKRGPFLWEHAPVRENCLNCHDPHGSNHDKLLVAKQPYLCQRCHLNTRHPGTLYDFRNTIAGTSSDQSRGRARVQELPPEHPRLQRAFGRLPREVRMRRTVFSCSRCSARHLRSGGPSDGSAEAPLPGVFTLGRIDFGVQQADPDTDSSKFREYRDVPNGIVMPFFRLSGRGKWQYDLVAENVLRKDGRYRLLPGQRAGPDQGRLQPDPAPLRQQRPHSARGDASRRSRDQRHAPERAPDRSRAAVRGEPHRRQLRLPEQSRGAFPGGGEHGRPRAPARAREPGGRRLTPDKPLAVKLNYFQEKRTGDRAAGTSFGFGNVVESPEPIDYRTEEFGASAEFGQTWGLVRGAVRYNTFTNAINTLTFDNPFRVTDSTDPSAYTGPASGSINGPARGRVDLSADNEALTGSVGFLVRLPGQLAFHGRHLGLPLDAGRSLHALHDQHGDHDAGRRDRSLRSAARGAWTARSTSSRSPTTSRRGRSRSSGSRPGTASTT